ncbi:MAG: SDR family oxidoreductase [Acidimicrobiales bacterium]|nr:SDR family oxidoreductase [Acidimicrobiales bacterium]
MSTIGTSITGKHALVTGGGSGIGLEAARRLATDGAHVTICGRTEQKLVDAVAAVEPDVGEGGSIRHAAADVTDEDELATAVGAASGSDGALEILVANAGGSSHIGPFESFDIDAVRATIDLNLLGTMLCIKHAVPAMKAAGGGSIVCISSGAGGFPHRWLWAYGAAKAGIDMTVQYAAEELGDAGIRVNSVLPGIVDNELMAPITGGGPLLDHYIENMPLGRVGQVDDIAEAVRFLAGPESSWITGANVPVDGGHHLRNGADYSRLFGGVDPASM